MAVARIPHCIALALCLGLPLSLNAVTARAAPKAASVSKTTALPVSHSKNVHLATLNTVDDSGVHVTLDDGTTLDAEMRPSSLFLVNGLAANATDFKPNTRVVLRTRTRASDGVVSVVMLCDLQTAASIEAYRRKPVVGKVVSADEKTLVVQPEGASAVPLTLHITAKTTYRKGGEDATAAAFPAGSPVAVITRGLPSGLLMASIVSDRSADAISEKAALKPISLVGTAVMVDADKGLLTLAPKTKPRQTIAVVDATKIKVEKADATLREVLQGMRVSARIGHMKDADGHMIATSISAFPLLPKSLHKKAPVAAKTP